jgi:hypothetical protein
MLIQDYRQQYPFSGPADWFKPTTDAFRRFLAPAETQQVNVGPTSREEEAREEAAAGGGGVAPESWYMNKWVWAGAGVGFAALLGAVVLMRK